MRAMQAISRALKNSFLKTRNGLGDVITNINRAEMTLDSPGQFLRLAVEADDLARQVDELMNRTMLQVEVYEKGC